MTITILFFFLETNTHTHKGERKNVLTQTHYQTHLVWKCGLNSKLIKDLVRYYFIFKTHVKLIIKPIIKPRLNLFFYKAYHRA